MAMPRTSEYCLHGPDRPRRQAYGRCSLRCFLRGAGFTLVELLVTLALMALVSGLVGPSVLKGLDNARERAWERSLVHALEALPLEAFRAGRALEVDTAALLARLPEWPRNRALVLDQPLLYSPEGVARGGTLELRHPDGRVKRWQVESYAGRVVERPS